MTLAEMIWTLVGLVLTLMVFSYALGDTAFTRGVFRLAAYLLVGVSAGFVAVQVIDQLLLPRLALPLLYGTPNEQLLTLVPLVLGILLLAKLSSRLSRWGRVPMAYLLGVGTAVMVGGAVVGTLIQQVQASLWVFEPGQNASPLGVWFDGGLVLAGTISTLVYFHFGAAQKAEQAPQRSLLVRILAGLGQVFIAVTLGALFAGVYAAALTALIERMEFILNAVKAFF